MSESHHKSELRADEIQIPTGSLWARSPLIAGGVGLVALVLAVVIGGKDAESFYASYLVAFMFFLSIGLGGLFFVLVHYASRAGWSVIVRRLAENAAASLLIMAILFLPLLFIGVNEIYHWAHFEHAVHEAEARVGAGEIGDDEGQEADHGELHSAVADAEQGEGEHGEGHALDYSGMTPDEVRATDPMLAGKLPYLNVGFWRIRAVFYVVVWALLAWFFRRRSVGQDEDGVKYTTRRLQGLSAPALIAFALTLTFAAFDWMMSLDPHWFSTIYGVYYFAGCVIAIYAFLSIMGVSLQRSGLLQHAITKEHYHDLGKMLFAFTVFWTYIAFSQYMLIWYANLPEETLWYHHRWVGSWKTVSILIGVGHFAVPFFYLMSRHIKRHKTLLVIGASWMLLMHLIDMYWLVMPVFHESGPSFGLVDLLLLVGIGGLFMAAYMWFLRRDALVPVKDPRLPESLAFENFQPGAKTVSENKDKNTVAGETEESAEAKPAKVGATQEPGPTEAADDSTVEEAEAPQAEGHDDHAELGVAVEPDRPATSSLTVWVGSLVMLVVLLVLAVVQLYGVWTADETLEKGATRSSAYEAMLTRNLEHVASVEDGVAAVLADPALLEGVAAPGDGETPAPDESVPTPEGQPDDAAPTEEGGAVAPGSEDPATAGAEAGAEGVEGAPDTVAGEVQEAADSAAETIQGTADTVAGEAQEAADSTAETIQGTADTVAGEAQEAADSTAETIEGAVETVTGEAQEAADSTAETIEGAVETVTGEAQEAADSAAEMLETGEEAADQTADEAEAAAEETVEEGQQAVDDAADSLPDQAPRPTFP